MAFLRQFSTFPNSPQSITKGRRTPDFTFNGNREDPIRGWLLPLRGIKAQEPFSGREQILQAECEVQLTMTTFGGAAGGGNGSDAVRRREVIRACCIQNEIVGSIVTKCQ
jgi:hypothetical protein